jgi:hypothetical protein
MKLHSMASLRRSGGHRTAGPILIDRPGWLGVQDYSRGIPSIDVLRLAGMPACLVAEHVRTRGKQTSGRWCAGRVLTLTSAAGFDVPQCGYGCTRSWTARCARDE